MPVGAFGGKAEIMSHIAPEGPVYQAGTLSANPIAMTAGKASLELLMESEFYETLREKTMSFTDRIRSHAEEKNYEFSIQQIGSIFWFAFSNKRISRSDQINASSMDKFKIMHSELLNRGVYLGPSGYEVGFVSAAHTEDLLHESAQHICDCLDIVFTK